MIRRSHLAWIGALLLADLAASLAAVAVLPERVPVHWDIHGQIDRYGSPWEFVAFGPLVALLTVGALLGVLAIARVRTALARSGTMYGRATVAIVGAMVAIHLAVLLLIFRAVQQHDTASPALASRILATVYVLLGVLLMVLGNWMGKIRRNPVFGIRTPWTLQSDVVWERTNRLGGRLLAGLGLAVLLTAIVWPFWASTIVMLAGLLGLCVWALVYSRRLAQAENRTPTEGSGAAQA
jgi:uncharacterized membrane protein